MKAIGTIIFFSLFLTSFGQKEAVPFKVEGRETGTWKMIFDLVDSKSQIITTLDTTKYASIDLNNQKLGYFAVFMIADTTGMFAIDVDEKILFEVYNRDVGVPYPDELIEGKIRIVDNDDRIGFANEFGQVVIEPQFEVATTFNKGKAIIGKECIKVPWHTEDGQADDCIRYSIECEKFGYIDANGQIKKIGDYTFDEIQEEINWTPE
jgi:predicted Rdx family selenoprotein